MPSFERGKSRSNSLVGVGVYSRNVYHGSIGNCTKIRSKCVCVCVTQFFDKETDSKIPEREKVEEVWPGQY